MLRSIMLEAVAPHLLNDYIPDGHPDTIEPDAFSLDHESEGDATAEPATSDDPEREELRCVIVVARHADRDPKQKIKMDVTDPLFLAYFDGKNPKKEVKLKSVKRMQSLLAKTSERLVTLFEQDAASLTSADTQVPFDYVSRHSRAPRLLILPPPANWPPARLSCRPPLTGAPLHVGYLTAPR